MSILKTIAIIGCGYLVVKYALPAVKARANLPASNCSSSNTNNADNGYNKQASSPVFPSLIKSISELINDATSTPQSKRIYY